MQNNDIKTVSIFQLIQFLYLKYCKSKKHEK